MWSELVEGYFNLERNIKLIIQIIDMRHSPSKNDMDMLEYLESYGAPFVIVLTKSDKLKKLERKKRMEEIEIELKNFTNIKLIPFSSVTLEGLDDLKNEIIKYVDNEE